MAKRQSSQFNTRQYMLREDFEVFYYSDTHFRSIGHHSHDYYELYFFEEGAVTMVIDGKAHPLRTGDVIVIPPGLDHMALLTDPEKPYRRFVFWQKAGGGSGPVRVPLRFAHLQRHPHPALHPPR